MSYVSFDGLLERFQGQIYNTRKGRLRMQLVDALYRKYLPLNEFSTWSVLDAGGGLGQMAHWFLQQGVSSVQYYDVAPDMVEAAKHNLADFKAHGQLDLEQASIESLPSDRQYDFVNVHAVFEWLETPMDVLPAVLERVKPGGYIGLMVYNRHMLMLRHLMRGTLDRAMSDQIGGDRRGLTPISPLDPQAVDQVLKNSGFEILTQAGIRSFTDLTEKAVLDWYDEESVFDAEMTLCELRPYCDLARYVLFIARREG